MKECTTGVEVLNRGSDYALRAMEVLAEGWEKGPVRAALIAMEAGVSESMLRKLLQKMVRAGLVVSDRGAAGGFRLGRRPQDITFLEVIEAVQGKFAVNKCFLGNRPCPERPRCTVRRKLVSVQGLVAGSLRGLNLAGLAENKSGTRVSVPGEA